MDLELINAIATLAERIANLANNDDEARDSLRRVAESVLKSTDRPMPRDARPFASRPDPTPPPAPSSGMEAGRPPSFGPPAPSPIPTPPPAEPTFARSPAPEATPRPDLAATNDGDDFGEADLAVVEERCRLKADGARWAAARFRLLDAGADFRTAIAPKDAEILARARDLDCFLWTNSPEFAPPRELVRLDDAYRWFEAVAATLQLVRSMAPCLKSHRDLFAQSLDLLAEAQSALRVVVDRVGRPRDEDQFRIYDWLRRITDREGIYIRRHMRLNDPADPARLPDLRRRIDDLKARSEDAREQARKRKSPLAQFRFHARLIGKGSRDQHDWRKVVEAVGQLVAEGAAPGSGEIRDTLLAIRDHWPDPDDVPPAFAAILREVDRTRAERPGAAVAATDDAEPFEPLDED